MNVSDICPVGALTTKDFRFKIRVWFLEDVPGVCTGCANGCNIYLSVANNKVYRYMPRRNDAVNDTWMCDAGRMTYKAIGAADRLKEPWLRSPDGALRAAAFDAVLAEAAGRLRRLVDAKGAGALAVLASPHATNEDLAVLRRLADALGVTARGVPVIRGESDELLIRAEKAANATGARTLGFGEARPVLERLRAGGLDGLLVLGHDVLDPSLLGDPQPLAALDTVVLLDTHHSALERVAHAIFPTRHAAEKHGTLTNHAGRVQRVEPTVEPAWAAWSEGAVLARLGAALGLEGFDGNFDPVAVSRELGALAPELEGLDLESVGDEGRELRGGGA